jgi:hypothetical protein
MMDLDQELEIALACLDQYSLDQERVRNMAKEYDENKALGLVIKKRHNQTKASKLGKTSRYKRVNDTSVFRNNARNFQFDYEEDYYEPHSKK